MDDKRTARLTPETLAQDFLPFCQRQKHDASSPETLLKKKTRQVVPPGIHVLAYFNSLPFGGVQFELGLVKDFQGIA